MRWLLRGGGQLLNVGEALLELLKDKITTLLSYSKSSRAPFYQ